MAITQVTCPKCQHTFSADEALSHEIEKHLQAKFQKDIDLQKESMRKDMLSWKEKQEQTLQEKEKAQEKLWQDKEKSLESTLLEKVKKEVSESTESELKLLKEENDRKSKELQQARELEIKIRQEKNKLEEDKKNFELEKLRQLDAERSKIREEAASKILEEHRFKDAEKDKQLADMKKQIEDLQLKANLTSQQLQGEVLELELEQMLITEFPTDVISPVAKGVRGADVTQIINDKMGRQCGTIIWESKRTKHWTEDWVQKLKDDLRASKADVAIIVSQVLPDGVKHFAWRDGVYVTSFDCLICLAGQIRMSMMELHSTRLSNVGKNEKMEIIYNYLAGNEFRQRVEAIVEAFTSMRQDLDQEKKVFARLWAKREKEIDRVINNTVGLHGDLQGLMGASLPQIPMLEITSLALESDNLS